MIKHFIVLSSLLLFLTSWRTAHCFLSIVTKTPSTLIDRCGRGQCSTRRYFNSPNKNETFLESPLSHLQDEEDNSLSRSFARSDKWLEEATEAMMDLQQYPVGSLSQDDLSVMAGLMAAWARRRSIHAALTVERLLKRVVDDMRAGNPSIYVNTRMYTFAIDAWAKSGAPGAARRAQRIHDTMVQMYKDSENDLIAPSVVSYNALMNAWGKSEDSPENADAVLKQMIEAYQAGHYELKPDAVSFSTVIDSYARSENVDGSKRAEELFELMDALGVKRNVYTFSALQNVYARSGDHDAPEKARAVLNRMQKLHENGDVFAKPNTQNYNSVLTAYSRVPTRISAQLADELLRKMESPVSEGGYDVEPDRLSYALTILACARCQDDQFGADLAEANLEKMESRAKLEAEMKRAVSSVAPPAVSLDLESFNVVLTTISKCKDARGPERVLRILKRMEKYASEGNEHIRPTIRTWNAILNTFARSAGHGHGYARKAERILRHVLDLHRSGNPNVKPDAFTFAAVLSAYQKSGHPRAAEYADAIVRWMEEMYSNGVIDCAPDVYHYTMLCGAWSRSRNENASDRCMQILGHMMERDRAGFPNTKPNVRTYNAILDCLARNNNEEKAEKLLYYMLHRYRSGDSDAKPDTFSFNTVIHSFAKSKAKGSGYRAESVLERLIEFSEEEQKGDVSPDARSFMHIISHYARSREMDAPYRAEYVLNRMISLFKSGQKQLAPTLHSFTTVMDSYSYADHRDAGKNAERLLKTMKNLRNEFGVLKLIENTSILNSVIFAWASSGIDDAGHHAEAVLDKMEKRFFQGSLHQKPNSRSYMLTILAWSRSACSEKANRAYKVLNRMKEQAKNGNECVCPNEHAYSLVINACAFNTGNGACEAEVFDIASKVLNQMLETEDSRPSSITFGWYIQACGRLRIPETVKESEIRRAFKLCCDARLLNDFVLHRLRSAASEALFTELVGRESSRGRSPRVSAGRLPSTWSHASPHRDDVSKPPSKPRK